MKKIFSVSLFFFFLMNTGFADFVPPPIDSSLDGSPEYQEQQLSPSIQPQSSSAQSLNLGNQNVTSKSNTGFTGTGFIIETSKFTVGDAKGILAGGNSASEIANETLGTIIQKMMIGIGIISFVIFVVGAAFMILSAGEDEYYNRGKSIFTAGITALIVSLSSYYLVALVRFLVFNNN